MIMRCQCWLIFCLRKKNCMSFWGVILIVGEAMCLREQGSMWKSLCLPLRFCFKPKTALKESILKNARDTAKRLLWRKFIKLNACIKGTETFMYSLVYCCSMWDLWFPDQGLNPHSLHWKCGALISGPPGDFQDF